MNHSQVRGLFQEEEKGPFDLSSLSHRSAGPTLDSEVAPLDDSPKLFPSAGGEATAHFSFLSGRLITSPPCLNFRDSQLK